VSGSVSLWPACAHEAVVPVLAAEPHVALDGEHLELLLRELHHRDVKGAAAEVVDEDGLRHVREVQARRLLKGIGESCGGGFVEDVEDFQPGDAAGVHRGLATGVVEICGDGDDALQYGADLGFRVLDELAEDDGRERFRAELAAGDRAAEVGVADAALDESGDAIRLLQRHVQRRRADHGGPVRRKVHGRRGEDFAVAVRHAHGPAALVQRGHGAERGAEVDAD